MALERALTTQREQDEDCFGTAPVAAVAVGIGDNVLVHASKYLAVRDLPPAMVVCRAVREALPSAVQAVAKERSIAALFHEACDAGRVARLAELWREHGAAVAAYMAGEGEGLLNWNARKELPKTNLPHSPVHPGMCFSI